MFEISVTEGAEREIRSLPARVRRMLIDSMEAMLCAEPLTATRNRKPLRPLLAPWSGTEPVWELRVDQYRVFYDVDPENRSVIVRAVRRKPPHRTTEDIL